MNGQLCRPRPSVSRKKKGTENPIDDIKKGGGWKKKKSGALNLLQKRK